MITTFLFDLGGVFFEADWKSINKQLYEKTGVYALPLDGSRHDFYLEFLVGKISIDDYFDRLRKAEKSNVSLERLKQEYKKAYIKHSKIDKNMISLLKKLHKKYYCVCVTSTNMFHEEINRERGLFKEFDKVFTSSDLKELKNETKIFKIVLAKINKKPEECIFIDDKEDHIKNAESLRIKGIHFKSFKQLKEDLKKVKCEKVEVFIFKKEKKDYNFLLLKRTKESGSFWQPVTGSVEFNEQVIPTAKREILEETGIKNIKSLTKEVHSFNLKAKPYPREHVFGAEVSKSTKISLDKNIYQEHNQYKWVSYQEAMKMLKWIENKRGLKRLNSLLHSF